VQAPPAWTPGRLPSRGTARHDADAFLLSPRRWGYLLGLRTGSRRLSKGSTRSVAALSWRFSRSSQLPGKIETRFNNRRSGSRSGASALAEAKGLIDSRQDAEATVCESSASSRITRSFRPSWKLPSRRVAIVSHDPSATFRSRADSRSLPGASWAQMVLGSSADPLLHPWSSWW